MPIFKIPLMKQDFTEEMREAAVHALQNERFVLGESVFKFEEEFARYCGTKHAIAVSSGTAALQLSLTALGAGQGKKVLTTPMSFIATANSVIHAGGVPIFSDIDEATGNLNSKEINPGEARGIIPVHLYGQPCEMDEILAQRDEGLFVVEDACQAHGAEFKGRKVGSLGDVGCFSFYPSKAMTVAGDGGMITTNNEEFVVTLKKLRDCGRTKRYEHDLVGYTYRLNTVNAVIGRVQLRYLDAWNEKRRKVAKLYRKLLPEKLLLKVSENVKHAYQSFVIKAKDRAELIRDLESHGIETGIHYPIPIHLQPIYRKMFGYTESDYPNAEHFASEVLSLPMHPYLSDDDVKYVCEKVLEFYS